MEKDEETEASPAEQELRLPDIQLDEKRFQDFDRPNRDERAEEESAGRVPFHDTDTPMA